MEDICWIPELILYEDYKNDWKSYEAMLYGVFEEDFIKSKPRFEGKQVNIRKHPMAFDKEEAFHHITCKDYKKDSNRVPDFRRCERIRWVRSFIENYNCDPTNCSDCDGIKLWEEVEGTKKRVHMLLEEERFVVVLERRDTYCLLVTAYYIEYENNLKKILRRYNDHK